MSSEYGLGTASIGVRPSNPNSIDTGLKGPAGSTAPLAVTTQSRIPYFQQNGLRISAPLANTITRYSITPGSIRDFSDSVDLSLGTVGGPILGFDLGNVVGVTTLGIPGAIVQVPLAGTISSSGTTVTGVNTKFTTDFGNGFNGKITDISIQRSVQAATNINFTVTPTISIAGFTTTTQAVVSDTSTGTANAMGAGAGTPYFRGGVTINTNTSTYLYAIILARKDIDNSMAVFASSFTISGVPDLPVGYTYYRCIGYISLTSNGATYNFVYIAQPLIYASMLNQGDMAYFNPNAGLMTTLPIGSSGQFLKVQSGSPLWSN